MPNNPNAIANLKPVQKGQVLNPKGRPPGVPNTATRLKRFLELAQDVTNPITGKIEKITVAEQMDLAMIREARKGSVKAYTSLIDRLEGKPKQAVDVTTKGEPIVPVEQSIVDKFVEQVKNDTAEQAKFN